MSLVNNMLRDLDQRRKGNLASPATVSLTPAVDEQELQGFRVLGPLVVIVSVLAVASVYYYLQLTSQDTITETVNRRPEPISEAVVLDTPAVTQGEREPEVQSEELLQISEPPVDSVVTDEIASSTPEETAPPQIVSPVIEQEDVPATDIALSQSPIEDSTAVPEVGEPVISADNSAAGSAVIRNNSQLSAQEQDAQNVQQALALFNANQSGAAFRTLSSYLQANGDAHQTRETYAKLLLSQNAIAEATQLIDEGLLIAPNRSGYKKIKARLMMADSQYAQAAALLASRAPALAEDVEYHEMLATAQLAGRDYVNAVTTYTSLIRHDNTEGKWWYGIGAAYDGLNDKNSAVQAYTQALQSADLSGTLRQRSQSRINQLRQ